MTTQPTHPTLDVDPDADVDAFDGLPTRVPSARGQRGATDPEGAQLRHTRAVRLRIAGASYSQIAEQLGYGHPASAARAVKEVLARNEAEAATDLRTLENHRLDLLTQNVTSIMVDRTLDTADRLKAANTLINASARRARLNGLDAPARVEVDTTVKAQALEALEELREVVVGTVVDTTDNTDDTDSIQDDGPDPNDPDTYTLDHPEDYQVPGAREAPSADF